MFKTAFENSILGRLAVYYETSLTKRAVKILAGYYRESFFVKSIDRFSRKESSLKYSAYDRAVNSINKGLTPVFKAIHDFLAMFVEGSIAAGIFFAFANNRTENKLRAVSMFMFYFLLAVAMLSIHGMIFSGYAAYFFVAALVFLFLEIFSRQMSAAFYNSFFMKILKGLIQ